MLEKLLPLVKLESLEKALNSAMSAFLERLVVLQLNIYNTWRSGFDNLDQAVTLFGWEVCFARESCPVSLAVER